MARCSLFFFPFLICILRSSEEEEKNVLAETVQEKNIKKNTQYPNNDMSGRDAANFHSNQHHHHHHHVQQRSSSTHSTGSNVNQRSFQQTQHHQHQHQQQHQQVILPARRPQQRHRQDGFSRSGRPLEAVRRDREELDLRRAARQLREEQEKKELEDAQRQEQPAAAIEGKNVTAFPATAPAPAVSAAQEDFAVPAGFSTKPKRFKPPAHDTNDDFETNLEALCDVFPVVNAVKPAGSVMLYDPYYCKGGIKKHWAFLGVMNVINEPRDAYIDLGPGGKLPQHDVFITNPPFSGNHLERLFEFLTGAAQQQPANAMNAKCPPPPKFWAVLVPDYLPTNKAWFKNLFQTAYGSSTSAPTTKKDPHASATESSIASKAIAAAARAGGAGSLAHLFASHPSLAQPAAAAAAAKSTAPAGSTASDAEEVEPAGKQKTASAAAVKPELPKAAATIFEPFYIVPRTRYEFDHPAIAGRGESHFRSLWIVYGGDRTPDLFKEVQCFSSSDVLLGDSKSAAAATAAAAKKKEKADDADADASEESGSGGGGEEARKLLAQRFASAPPQLFSSLEKLLAHYARLKAKKGE